MIRLTVLYSLAEGVDEAAFIEWRTNEQRKYVNSMSGVLRNDFSRIDDISPAGSIPNFRFQTVVDWADRETFESAFYSDAAQQKLDDDRKMIGDQTFIVSEIIAGE